MYVIIIDVMSFDTGYWNIRINIFNFANHSAKLEGRKEGRKSTHNAPLIDTAGFFHRSVEDFTALFPRQHSALSPPFFSLKYRKNKGTGGCRFFPHISVLDDGTPA